MFNVDMQIIRKHELELKEIENKIEKHTANLDLKCRKNKAGVGGFVSVNRAFRLAVYRGLVMDLNQKRFDKIWQFEVDLLEMPYHD